MMTPGELHYLKKYGSSDEVREIVSVVCYENGDAVLSLFEKKSACWNQSFQVNAAIGRDGLGKQREGDMKTPIGDFGIITAFGIKDNPGTSLPYLLVDDTLFCCDEEGAEYNRFVHHPCSGEHICEYLPQYNYGLFLDYNKDGVYPLGSAIFIHVLADKNFTAGCVAIPEPEMKELLRRLSPGARVVISLCVRQG